MSNKKSCCCSKDERIRQENTCTCGSDAIAFLDKSAPASLAGAPIPELINSGSETFQMFKRQRLTAAAEGLWNLHKEIIDATMYDGWDNADHPWNRNMQNFWKYPLAFATYGLPSLIMIEPARRDEVCEYLRKSLLLFKDTPVWDGWKRQGYGDPVSKDNIMYKGHLNLIYGLYQLVSGSREFEDEYRQLTSMIIGEYDANKIGSHPYWGICCEPDQYFSPCNSVGMLSMKVHDLLFNTDYDRKYSENINKFFREKMCDQRTGIIYGKYHPSHDHAEAYLTGFYCAWSLTLVHRYEPEHYERAYRYFIQDFAKDLQNDQVYYLKEYPDYDEASTAVEESMGTFYTTALAKEYGDSETWEKFERYFVSTYGMKLEDHIMRLTKATPADETFVHNYLLYGNLHLGWEKMFNYDWKTIRRTTK